jgi:hypothetical protein
MPRRTHFCDQVQPTLARCGGTEKAAETPHRAARLRNQPCNLFVACAFSHRHHPATATPPEHSPLLAQQHSITTQRHAVTTSLPNNRQQTQCRAITRRSHRPLFLSLTNLSQRSSNVPQAVRHRHRPPLRQMRRQMPRVRLLRATDNSGAHLRRMQLRQLPKQVCRLRRRGHFGCILLLRVHTVGKRPGWMSKDYQSGQFTDGCEFSFLPPVKT